MRKMASSPLNLRSKAPHFHARSVSLPSTSHPLLPQFNEHMCRAFESTSSSSSSSSSSPSMSSRLSGLEDLYDCIDALILLPSTQQTFARGHHEKWVDEALDGFLRLLDVCSIAKEVCSQTKQDVRELLSSLRRRRSGMGNIINGYLIARKKAQKAIHKYMKDLKTIKNKRTHIGLDTDHETMAIVTMLNEAETITLTSVESLLTFVAATKVQSRPSKWSLVSKLMQSRKVACEDEEETDINEFEKVDGILQSLMITQKTSKSGNTMDVDYVQMQLGKMESSIQDLEEGLESLSRRLIRTRVSLLNVLNH
ncbi:unnamed protein product [Ilex paraguariensis]|uniref:DUF241 domain protein n=1 Tax=Ilex paraguariensis TaxID=185542 RepID=A0ABC8S9M1_9AQUA